MLLAKRPLDFRALLRDAARLCQELEDAVVAGAPAAELNRRLKAVNDSCKGCHVEHRDNQ